jgi:hypothetical protein
MGKSIRKEMMILIKEKQISCQGSPRNVKTLKLFIFVFYSFLGHLVTENTQ